MTKEFGVWLHPMGDKPGAYISVSTIKWRKQASLLYSVKSRKLSIFS